MCRNRLNEAVERAYPQQAFGPIKALFSEEEVALATFERAKTKLARLEERRCSLQAALIHEKELMLKAPLSRRQLN
jgi:hypothetical protein